MKLLYALCLLILFPLGGISQQLTLVTKLEELISETSGLAYLNGKIISHNDSRGQAALYEIDPSTGKVTRTVVIKNAKNIDWEEVTFDNNYLYIGDIGNNKGSRTNLRIYRVPVSEYVSAANDTVSAEVINFHYSDQKDFTSNQYATNYDAEALLSYQGKLYIFTKNWLNSWTNIYAVLNQKGDQTAVRIDSINVKGLVTGAVYNVAANKVLLSVNNLKGASVVELTGFSANLFSNGGSVKYQLAVPSGYSAQIEGITPVTDSYYYLSAEQNDAGLPALYGLTIQNILSLEDTEERNVKVYPNPASTKVNIDYDDFSLVGIYNLQGVLQKSSAARQIDLSDLEAGIYVLVIESMSRSTPIFRKLVIL